MTFVRHKGLVLTILLLPAALFYVIYVVATLFTNISISFLYWDGVARINFAGLRNWTKLFGDKDFWNSMKNTAVIFAGIFCIMIPLAFSVSTILAKNLKAIGVFKIVFFAPIVVSSIMVGLVWSFILDPASGLVNSILFKLGLDAFALEWIGGRTLSPYSIAYICIWQWMGINTVIFLTGIKAIPESLFESAVIDGARDRYIALHITLPMIRESLLSSAILNIAGVFKVYEIVLSLTNGGPGYSSCTIAAYMMAKMFDESQFGYGSVISTVIFVLCTVLSIILISLNNSKKVQY